MCIGFDFIPYDAVEYPGNKALVLNTIDNRVYLVDCDDGIISDYCKFHDGITTKEPTGSLVIDRDCIIGIPNMEPRIAIYNMNDKRTEYISIPEKGIHFSDGRFLFSSGVIYDRKLYIFGNAYLGIVSFDLDTFEMEIINDWIDFDRNYNPDDGCFHLSFYVIDHTVYLPFMNTNAVLEFDLKSKQGIIHNVGDSKQRYLSIERIKDEFYLIPRDGRNGDLVRWNPKTGETKQYSDYPQGFDYNRFPFYRSATIGDELVVMFAHRGNMNIIFDSKTEQMKELGDLYDSSEVKAKKYSAMIKKSDIFYFFTPKGIVKWDYHNDMISVIDYVPGGDVIQRIETEKKVSQRVNDLKTKLNRALCVCEENQDDLRAFLRV